AARARVKRLPKGTTQFSPFRTSTYARVTATRIGSKILSSYGMANLGGHTLRKRVRQHWLLKAGRNAERCAMRATVRGITITRLPPHTGAEVLGIDLRQPLTPMVRERLNRALVEHSVLVIRGQRLLPSEFLAAMQNFGEIFPQHNPRFAVPECPLVHYIS